MLNPVRKLFLLILPIMGFFEDLPGDLSNGVKKIILEVIKFYQNFISPYLNKNCRFYPSCSDYIFLTIEKYGILKGIWKGFKRILKCHPWQPGGIDLP